MVFKKYSYKDGKKYGPYLYKNTRVGDKVVTEYVGRGNESNNSGSSNYLLLLGLFLFAILLTSAFFILFHVSPTGFVTLDVQPQYNLGDSLNGIINFNFKSGELIPKDSLIQVSLGGQTKELPLSSLIADNIISGDYYAEQHPLTGSGEGYGVIGERTVYPTINFDVLVKNTAITPISNSNENTDSNSQSSSENSSQEITNENTETGNTNTETPVTETPTNPTQNTGSSDTSSTSSESSSSTSSESSSSTQGSTETSSASSSSSSTESSSESGSSSSESSSSDSGITGNAIGEDEFTVSGSVSKGQDFEYNLDPGQTAELVSGSLKVNDESVDDNLLRIRESSSKLTISTDYSIQEKGFGRDYLGDFGLALPIDLQKLGMFAENGTLTVKIISQGETIAHTEKEIGIRPDSIPENDTITLIKQIPTQRIGFDSSIKLNLNDYFSGAIRYEFVANNIVADFNSDDSTLVLTPEKGFKGARKAKIIAITGTNRVESNEFNILVSSGAINIETSHSQIKVGEKVKWTQNITLDSPENITIEVPKAAENISIQKLDENSKAEEVSQNNIETSSPSSALTGNVVIDIELHKEPRILTLFKGFFSHITGNAIEGNAIINDQVPSETKEVTISDNSTQYTVEYTTPAPTATETDTREGKQVTVSAADELGYTNVLAYANIPEIYSVGQEDQIKIYWSNNESYLPFDAYDTDGNGKLDYIEWNVPHLSTQNFQIILITKAMHLDSNKNILEDIYSSVQTQDGNFVTIPSGDYIQVTFASNLTAGKDMTLVAKGNGTITVYNINSNVAIGTFNIAGENTYKIFPSYTNSDVYNLKFFGNIEVDYIVDPDCGSIGTDNDCLATPGCNSAYASVTCTDFNSDPSTCSSAGCSPAYSYDTNYCSINVNQYDCENNVYSGCSPYYYDCASISNQGDCDMQSSNGCISNTGDCAGLSYPDCTSTPGCGDYGDHCEGSYFTSCSGGNYQGCAGTYHFYSGFCDGGSFNVFNYCYADATTLWADGHDCTSSDQCQNNYCGPGDGDCSNKCRTPGAASENGGSCFSCSWGCAGGLSCINSVCTDNAIGSYCDEMNPSCTSGYCTMSTCTLWANGESGCTTSADCQSGLTCIGSNPGTCVLADGSLGAYCNNNGECNSGYCNTDSGNSCQLMPINYYCTTSDQCITNYCEPNSLMCQLGPDGNNCSSNEQCVSNLCSGGVCANPYTLPSTIYSYGSDVTQVNQEWTINSGSAGVGQSGSVNYYYTNTQNNLILYYHGAGFWYVYGDGTEYLRGSNDTSNPLTEWYAAGGSAVDGHIVPTFSLNPQPALIAEYNFENNANDVLGVNNGTWYDANGDPTSGSYAPGVSGQAASFNDPNGNDPGGDGTILIPIYAPLHELTYSYWVNRGTDDGQGFVASYSSYDGGFIQTEFAVGSAFTTSINDGKGNSAYFITYDNINEFRNKWTFVTQTVDSSGNSNLYIDGQLVDSINSSTALDNLSTTLQIGGYSGQPWFNGKVDQVKIYNYALNSSQIAAEYAANAPAATPISDCTTITGAGEYSLTTNIGSGGDCLIINASNVVINGNGFTVTGNINGSGVGYDINGYGNNGFNFNVTNTTIVGSIISNGVDSTLDNMAGKGGIIYLNNVTGNPVISSTGGVATSSGSGGIAGNGGTIIATDSNLGTIYIEGSDSLGYPCTGSSGSGGILNITNSNTGNIFANAGNNLNDGCGGYSGSGGSVNVNASNVGSISAHGGAFNVENPGSGGNGGTIYIWNPSTYGALNISIGTGSYYTSPTPGRIYIDGLTVHILGDNCADTGLCSSPYVCNTISATCTAGDVNDPCGWNNDCPVSGYCDLGNYLCTDGSDGNSCDYMQDNSVQCSSGYCDANTNTCYTLPGLGEDCSAYGLCQAGLTCGAGSICTDGTLGNACFSDNTCSGYYCSGISGLCTNGESGVDSCNDGSQCSVGYCGMDNICGLANGDGCGSQGPSSICRGGFCSGYGYVCTDGSSTSPCNDGDQCQSGLVCMNNQCTTAYCGDGSCNNGETCGDGSDSPGACTADCGYCANGESCSNPGSSDSNCATNVCGSNSLCGLTTGTEGCSIVGELTNCQSGFCLDDSNAGHTSSAAICSDKSVGSPCSGSNQAIECSSTYCSASGTNAGICTNGANGDACGDGSNCVIGACGSDGYCGLANGDSCDYYGNPNTCRVGSCIALGTEGPYYCSDGEIGSTCTSDSNCISQNCDTINHVCLAPAFNCSTISSPGVYTLTKDISAGEGNVCLQVQADNVEIDCGGNSITGNIDSSGSGYNQYYGGNPGYSNLTLNNCNVTGQVISNGAMSDSGGSGGIINIISSTISEIIANGGAGTSGVGASGGIITLTGSNVGNVFVNGGSADVGNSPGSGGQINVVQSNTGNLSALGGTNIYYAGSGGAGGIINITNPSTYGNLDVSGGTGIDGSGASGHIYIDGAEVGGTISSCETISTPGNFTLTQNISAEGDCLIINANDVVINGDGYTINGNVNGNGENGEQSATSAYSFNLTNIIVTGSATSDGGSAQGPYSGGAAGTIVITGSVLGSVSASGGNAANNGGKITLIDSSTTNVIANGASSYGGGSNGGLITLIRSNTTNVIANGAGGFQGDGGAGGMINITTPATWINLSVAGGTGGEGYSNGARGHIYIDGIEKFYGCTDPSAVNYNASATFDDGSCIGDTIYPLIEFTTGTPESGITQATNSIYANVSVVETNFVNLTINLYNSTGLKSSQTFTNNLRAYNFTSLIDGTYYLNATACDLLNQCNSTETRTITIDTVAPTVSFILPTENDNGYATPTGIVRTNVSTTGTLTAITFDLINASGSHNITTYSGDQALSVRSYSFQAPRAGTYTYKVNVTSQNGLTATTATRSIIVEPSCLVQCSEGSNNDCTINSECYLSSAACANSVCNFRNFVVNSTIRTLYEPTTGNGLSLDLNLSGNMSFVAGNNHVIFDGRPGSDIGAGSAGGNAGVVNISVPGLFNTTFAMFSGMGGASTIDGAAGGNGGFLQINARGLIRNFDDAVNNYYDPGLQDWVNYPSNAPQVFGGNDVNWENMGSDGGIIFTKNLECSPRRDTDITNDGQIDSADWNKIKDNYNDKKAKDANFSDTYDINCDGTLNVREISRIGFELGTR